MPDKKLIDRPLFAKLMTAAMGAEPMASVALSKAKAMMREAGVDWYDMIPGSRLRTSIKDDPPPFVERVERSVDQSISILLNSRDEARRSFARELAEIRGRGGTITGQGVRLLHKYANQEVKR